MSQKSIGVDRKIKNSIRSEIAGGIKTNKNILMKETRILKANYLLLNKFREHNGIWFLSTI